MKYLAVAMLLLTGCVSSRTYNKNMNAQIELDRELADSNIVMSKALLKYKERLDALENRIVNLKLMLAQIYDLIIKTDSDSKK